MPMAGGGDELATAYGLVDTRLHYAEATVAELGVGRGGKIVQKIYPDPHGIAVWCPVPTALASVYLVSAADFTRITGQVLPLPRHYYGSLTAAFQVTDGTHADTAGSTVFEHLQPAEPAAVGVPVAAVPAPDTFPGGKGRRRRH